MPDFLEQLSAFTVFLCISGFGFFFLLISLIFGELFDFFDHDHDFDGGGGPSFLSGRVLSVLVTAFGAIGAIGVNAGFSVAAASVLGVGGGAACAGAVYWFARFLFSQQASSQSRSSELVGRTARVVVAIPSGGVGQVRCQSGEELLDKIARSRSGEAVAENTIVTIDQVLGEIVVVEVQRKETA